MTAPTTRELLGTLREVAAEAPSGYVALQPAPYRGHHLSAAQVLEHTEPGDAVFEAGVSSGYFSRVLVAHDRVVDGFELDPEAAVEAEEVCRSVHVGDLDAYDLEGALPDAGYQVVLFGDTLEHLPDPSAVLRRLRPKLVDDGRLIISIPNIANWTMRLSLLAGRFRYTDRGILDRTHLRFYTRRGLIEMLDEAGFVVEHLEGSIPVPGVANETLCRIAHRLGNLRPSLFAYTFVVVARPSSFRPSSFGPSSFRNRDQGSMQ